MSIIVKQQLNEFKNVLILISDNHVSSYMRLLASFDGKCKVVLQSDHNEACKFFVHNKVDLVLLCHSNSLQYITLFKKFQLIEPSVPVFLVVLNDGERFLLSVFSLGVVSSIKSPFSKNELINTIYEPTDFLSYREVKKVESRSCLCRALSFIHRNYCDRISLSEVAREAGMSISCFVKCFKSELGTGFSVYINDLRVSKAMGMLKKSNKTICTIALECGFTNQFHFTRTFKKITKTSPSLFRKSILKGYNSNV